MAIAYKSGPSVEAARLSLVARNIRPRLSEKHPVLDTIVWNFEIRDNAEAVIDKALNPQKSLINSDSLLIEGDAIHGEIINGFTDKVFKSPIVTPGTHRHRAQCCKTSNGFSYAQIKRIWQSLIGGVI